MNPAELVFTLALAAVLLGLAGYFGWRQVQTLRGLAGMGVEEQHYLRAQAYRRLFCSALMVVLAGMLVGWIFLGADAADPAAPLTADLARLFSVYWIAALLVLLVLVALAAVDFWAIARFGMSQHRRLQADQRALLEEHAARRRRERNGSQ